MPISAHFPSPNFFQYANIGNIYEIILFFHISIIHQLRKRSGIVCETFIFRNKLLNKYTIGIVECTETNTTKVELVVRYKTSIYMDDILLRFCSHTYTDPKQ